MDTGVFTVGSSVVTYRLSQLQNTSSGALAQVVVACQIISPAAYKIFLPKAGIKRAFRALHGGFLTTEPAGRPLILLLTCTPTTLFGCEHLDSAPDICARQRCQRRPGIDLDCFILSKRSSIFFPQATDCYKHFLWCSPACGDVYSNWPPRPNIPERLFTDLISWPSLIHLEAIRSEIHWACVWLPFSPFTENGPLSFECHSGTCLQEWHF